MLLSLICSIVPFLSAFAGAIAMPTNGTATASAFFATAPNVSLAADGWTDVTLDDAFLVRKAGQPILPESVILVQLPAGAHVTACVVTPHDTETTDLAAPVRYGPAPAAFSRGPGVPAQPDPVTYASNTALPALDDVRWTLEQHDGASAVRVRLAPIQYNPLQNCLFFHPQLDVAVSWNLPPKPVAHAMANSVSPLPAGQVDYVVITSAALLQTPPPYNFQALCAARSRDGFTTTNVTVEWIYANYPGTRPDGGTDNATQIRNFIIDAHQNWGTRFVLLGGAAYNPVIIPARLFYDSVETGSGPYTSQIGADLYYACLGGTFDANANGVYGESNDGDGGGDVDLTADVYVGRFPVTSTSDVANMVRKTLAYENAPAAQLKKISHDAEYLGFGGISDYASPMMEQLRLGGSYDGYTTVGFNNSVYGGFYDISDTLYDSPSYSWPNSEIIKRFNGNFHVFNHLGHGNYFYDFKLDTWVPQDYLAILNLTNSVFFFAYSQACLAGEFDDTVCIAQLLATAANGPAAVVMNDREGWGAGYTTDGPSQRFHRYFWDELLSGRCYMLGEASQKSKEDLQYLVNDYSGAMRWCYYSLTYFGDPALPFAASVSQQPATIIHTPLSNQLTSAAPFRVTCQLGPPGLYDPATAQIVWRTSLAPSQVRTAALVQVSGTLYEYDLPAAPTGATIFYSLHLSTRAGVQSALPASGECSFFVTTAYPLTISGSPQNSSTVTPPYGVSQVVSGNTVQVSAVLREEHADGSAWRCAGWRGSGSVPASGSSNQVAFVITQSSALTWLWTNEYRLAQTTLPSGLIAATNWCTAGSLATTVVAAASVTNNFIVYHFAGWYLDSVRQPIAGCAANPVTAITMNQPHHAGALYLPATQDSDGDSLPDWWEMFYFGTLAYGPADDPDRDGWNNLDEYRAGTDPTSVGSHPAPPVIAITPLPPVLSTPPAYTITAIIADCSPVNAQLVWRQNNSGWQTNAMAPLSSVTNGYYTWFSFASTLGDVITYYIIASDADFLFSQSATFTSVLQYAVVSLVQPLSASCTTAPPATVNNTLAFANTGNAALVWHAYAGFGESADAPPADWNLAAAGGFAWTWDTNRCASAPGSFHAHITSPPYHTYISQHACMDSPLITLGTNAILSFRYWMYGEYEGADPGYCFDGGIIEISTNNGQTFVQLPGPYTYLITGWFASPWPNDTPCFSGPGDDWHDVTFDLSAYAGQQVRLRFHYGADDNTDREGWYVDDIRVAPLQPEAMNGVTFTPATGVIAPQATNSLTVTVDTSRFNKRWLRVPVLVRSNDPLTTNFWYELAFEVLHPPQLTFVASQSTNGDGLVTVAGAVCDPDGENRELSFIYSPDNGATWLAPYFSQSVFDHGTSAANAAQSSFALGLADGEPAYPTNSFVLTWDTRNPNNNISLSMNTLLIGVATDPVFGPAMTSATPFPIDNQPPVLSALNILSGQSPQQWSAVRQLTFSWNATDGAGTGIQNQFVSLSHPADGPGGTNLSLVATPSQLSFNLDSDSSNWWLSVTACDFAGNAATNTVGPFWIDATPPDTSAASIQTTWGRYGNYVVGTSLPLIATQFNDALSGIATYTFQNVSRSDATPVTITSNTINWSAVALNATNTFRVFAIDCAGNSSDIISVDILILDPFGDFDHDGINNAEEELIGTSPFMASKPFTVAQTASHSGGLLLGWPATAGSVYTIEGTPTLTNANWVDVPGLSNLPGSNGLMAVPVPTGSGSGFYRVRVSR
jgi:hypothetical protein